MAPSPKKRPPQPHELLLWTAPQRPPRKEREPRTSAAGVGVETQLACDEAESLRHREAVREYKDRCQGAGSTPWVTAEALLYLADGDRIVERYALWLFPSETERFLTSTSTSPSSSVHEFFVLVRFEGRGTLTKLSLGVCQTGRHAFQAAHATQDAPLEVDPTAGQVLRIVSIERDGEQLQHPEDASPFLHGARHIREVIRKHAAKCDHISSSDTLHRRFAVLRTQAYLDAREALKQEDCDGDTWATNLAALEDPSSFPWHLANRVAGLGAMALLAQAKASLPARGQVHIVDDIWLVHEELPLSSNEFVVAARWAIQKSIKGTGSIPKAKMWEPVVLVGRDGRQEFRLMRMA